MSKKYNREFPHVSTSISDQKVICKKNLHLLAPQNIVESKSHPTKKGVAILVGKIMEDQLRSAAWVVGDDRNPSNIFQLE